MGLPVELLRFSVVFWEPKATGLGRLLMLERYHDEINAY
jgi:hypothetical protein